MSLESLFWFLILLGEVFQRKFKIPDDIKIEHISESGFVNLYFDNLAYIKVRV